MKPPYAIGSVPSLSGHAVAFRWRSLPRVRRHRASKPQGSSERVLPWQITLDQLIFASLSHTHYWYEVGMLKVPACIQYFGEMKNERFFQERCQRSYFLNHLADSARRRRKRKLLSIRSRKNNRKYKISVCDMPIKSYSDFKKSPTCP